jgi:hypothetical protein
MKKLILLILFPATVIVTTVAQENRHVVSIAASIGLSIENSMYIDFDQPDFEIWSEPDNNIAFTAGYEYRLNEFIRIGAQLEIEKINFESYYTGEAEATRIAYGLTGITQYPAKPFHMELGGFINLSSANSDEFENNLAGIEYGLTTGPVYTLNRFEVGLLFKPQFSYFFADEEEPSSALLMYPRLALRVSYAF